MAAVKKRAPERPLQVACKADADQETLRAVVGNRLHVMADYGRVVLQRVHREEVRNAVSHQRAILKSLASLLTKAEHRFSEGDHRTMQEALRLSESLATVYIFRERLQKLYDQRHESRDRLLEQLREWCRQAEGSGIAALRDFSLLIKSYAPPAAAR
jgi:stearoyl-CoA desaturase (delta-9 desaturase)